MGITKQGLIGNPNNKTKEMYKILGVMLEEVIQKGLDIIVLLNKNLKNEFWEMRKQQVTISILKEILEKIDGIIILSEKYSQQNISVLARSVLEGFLDLNFILKKSKRAIAYDYCKTLDYISKYEKMELSVDDREGIKLIQQELGEELKNQRGKKKENKDYRLDWRNFYLDKEIDDPYKDSGAKIHYSFLCAETHNQRSLVNNYSANGNFNLRSFRDVSETGIGLISQMIVGFSGEIFERIIKLYIQEPSSELESLEKWREEKFERSEKLIQLDDERLSGTTKIGIEI